MVGNKSEKKKTKSTAPLKRFSILSDLEIMHIRRSQNRSKRRKKGVVLFSDGPSYGLLEMNHERRRPGMSWWKRLLSSMSLFASYAPNMLSRGMAEEESSFVRLWDLNHLRDGILNALVIIVTFFKMHVKQTFTKISVISAL